MSTLTFRGSILNRFDCRQGREGGDTYVRLYVDCDLTKPVCEAMEWSEPGDGAESGKLTGVLVGRLMVVVPGDKALAKHEIQMDVSEARDFHFTSEVDDKGAVKKRLLHFTIKTSAKDAESQFRRYMDTIGRHHKSQLKLNYEVSEQLDLAEAEEGQTAVQ